MINSLHKTTAFHIKQLLNIEVKPLWYQYWDRRIRDEKHYFRTATYVLYNPVKHGYVNDLKAYPYSSFHVRYESDEEGLRRMFQDFEP